MQLVGSGGFPETRRDQGQESICKGEEPKLDLETYYAAPERERGKLVEKGLVRVEQVWFGKFYGSMTVDLVP